MIFTFDIKTLQKAPVDPQPIGLFFFLRTSIRTKSVNDIRQIFLSRFREKQILLKDDSNYSTYFVLDKTNFEANLSTLYLKKNKINCSTLLTLSIYFIIIFFEWIFTFSLFFLLIKISTYKFLMINYNKNYENKIILTTLTHNSHICRHI